MSRLGALAAMLAVALFASASAEAVIAYDGQVTEAEWGAYYLASMELDVYGYYDDDYIYFAVEIPLGLNPETGMWGIGQMVAGSAGIVTPGDNFVSISLSWLPPTDWAPGGAWDWNYWGGVWVNGSTNDAPARYHPFWNMGWDDGDPEWNSLDWFGGEYGYTTGYEIIHSRCHGGPVPGDCTTAAYPDWWPGPPWGALDADGVVTFADYQELERNFGKAGNYRDGDFDGNGTVQFNDYQILEAWYGDGMAIEVKIPWSLIEYHTGELTKGTPLFWMVNLLGYSEGAVTRIPYIGGGARAPEPATIGLLGLGVLALLRKRR